MVRQTVVAAEGGVDVENVEIEVRARTVDLAIEAAMQELGIDDPKRLEVEVITEPTKGFLGIGA